MTTAANHEIRQGSMQGSAGLDFFEKGFTLFGLMFMSGGLTRVLTGGLPEDVASTTSTPLVLLSGLVVYLLAAVFIGLRFPRFFPLILYSLVLWVPVVLALASVYWSVDPGSTFRRATALFGTTLFGVYIALRFSLNELATLLFIALCAIVSVSLLVAVVIPGFGVHQAGDAITAHHAGLWRGLFWHKNKLGPVASILALIIVALWPRINFGIFVKLAALAISGIVVVGAGSSQALFQFTVFSGLLVIHRLFSGLAMSSRIAVLAAAMPVAFLCFLFLGEIQEFVLDLLNRDATLSSRTYIWQAAFVAGREHFLLGNGYNVGWFGGADEIAQRLYYISVSQAHNGYLQIWLELGLVGLASLAVVWLVMIYRVIGVSRYSYDMYITTLYFLLYYFVSNYVTAFLMTYNDLSWVLFSAFFIMCMKVAQEALPGNQPVPRFPEAPSQFLCGFPQWIDHSPFARSRA